MSTHGMLPDNGSAAASNPLMPAFNPGESVFAVDTSKLNQALMWIMHSTKKHSADIDEVKRDTSGLLAQLAQQRAAAAAPADDGLIKELESKEKAIEAVVEEKVEQLAKAVKKARSKKKAK